jgi:hypothetical protein
VDLVDTEKIEGKNRASVDYRGGSGVLSSCLAGYSTSGSASGVRATDKTLDGVESKNKAIITRFDIG